VVIASRDIKEPPPHHQPQATLSDFRVDMIPIWGQRSGRDSRATPTIGWLPTDGGKEAASRKKRFIGQAGPLFRAGKLGAVSARFQPEICFNHGGVVAMIVIGTSLGRGPGRKRIVGRLMGRRDDEHEVLVR